MAKKEPNIGIITEQNDLGLGFDKITLEEEKTIKANDKTKDKKPYTKPEISEK